VRDDGWKSQKIPAFDGDLRKRHEHCAADTFIDFGKPSMLSRREIFDCPGRDEAQTIALARSRLSPLGRLPAVRTIAHRAIERGA
jgi:hypothetical protein